MAKKFSDRKGQKVTPLEDYLDPDVLAILRTDRGKTTEDMGKLFGIHKYSYTRMEGHGMSRWTLGIARLRQLCAYLNLDPLEVCELLKHPWIPEVELKMFRQACRKAEEDPKNVLRLLMKSYQKAVLRGE